MEKLRENLKKILDIQKIFIKAKNDNGQTFLDKILKFDKQILEKILNYYKNGIKVNKVRYDIVKQILDGKKINLEDIEDIKKQEQKKYGDKKIFRSWTYFSILHTIYYFDKKDFVNNFLEELNKDLVKDLNLENKVKINIVDFTGAQNFGQIFFWTAIYNKSHKSQKTALQLNITSFDEENKTPFNNYKISIGLGSGPEVKENKKENWTIFDLENLEYKNILEIFEKNKNFILEDIKQENKQQFWTYSPGENGINWEREKKEKFISIGWDELGDLTKYKTREEFKEKYTDIYGKKEKNNELANWDFCNNINIGDIIFVKQGNKKILGYGEIIGNYYFDNNEENHKSKINVEWKEIKEITLDDIEKIDIKQLVQKTLTNITKYEDLVEYLKNKFSENNNQCIMHKTILQKESEQLLNSKKQIILYGPPGTGKTFNVKSIIENHSGEKYEDLQADGKIEFITFHQSFSYEEFIEGIKADLDSNDGEIKYKIEDGVFKNICEKAENNSYKSINKKKTYDEIYNDLKYNFFEGNFKEFKTITGIDVNIEDITDKNIKVKSNGAKNVFSIKKTDLKEVVHNLLNGTLKKPIDIKSLETVKADTHALASYYFSIGNIIIKKIESSKNIEEEKKNYYLIIDEINRGNISKIFGELITLLEADKRIGGDNEIKTKLPYSKESFGIPENLYIIATMNTSDKSIVSLDTALRRRFGFVEMLPDYDLVREETKKFTEINLGNLLEKLNDRIEYLLDKDHLIGHSYFFNINNISDLKLAIFNEILPLLEEYFYSEEENIIKVLGSKFFTEIKIDNKLFEKNNDSGDDNVKYEIKKELLKDENNKSFIDALKNILDNQKSLEGEKI